ncbi:MAG: hypothetical protein GXP50_10960 [Deltaproteobacteria bacterium]|nr:hypothetical protein [Deltaproteobacteria bacterium]
MRARPSWWKMATGVAVVFFLTTNVSLYRSERRAWLGPENTNRAAKEYYVWNSMVFAYRSVLAMVLRPDHPLMAPLNALQDYLYEKGVSLLPPGDGEVGIWKWKFKLYLYGRRDYMPEDRAVEMLDDLWEVLETLGTQPISDPEMELERLKTFPTVALFYSLHQWKYFGTTPSPERWTALIGDQDKAARASKIAGWLQKVREGWSRHPSVQAELARSPIIRIAYYWATVGFTETVLSRKNRQGELTCEDPYLALFLQVRREFLDAFPELLSAYPNSQMGLTYRGAFGTDVSKTLAYLSHEVCGAPKDLAYPTHDWIAQQQENLQALARLIRRP